MSMADITFPTLLQDFFQRRLVSERGVSAHTIASYRDSFGLLLRYAESRTGRAASTLTVQDLDAPMILSFLDHLESERKCGARTRNLRLTAIRSFMRYVSIRDPASLPVAQRVLAIAGKRFDRPVLEFLSRDEIQALLDAPDREPPTALVSRLATKTPEWACRSACRQWQLRAGRPAKRPDREWRHSA